MKRRKNPSYVSIDRLLDRIERDIPGGLVVVEDLLRDFAEEGGKQRRAFERFHWGDAPTRLETLGAPAVRAGDVLIELGELAEVAYDGEKEGDFARWVHPFEDEKPVLASTEQGKLVVVGGSYKVTPRGIVG